jgi:hypothetical protein
MPARPTAFDPRGILAALEGNHVDYVLIGGLAQVLRGADRVTGGIDICPSFGAGNLDRLADACAALHAIRQDRMPLQVTEDVLGSEPVVSLRSDAGDLRLIASPAGAPGGYVDLRRAATREHLGQGLQTLVASTADLARMAAALHREQDVAHLKQLRRIMELEASRQPMPAATDGPAHTRRRKGVSRGPRLSH